MHSRYQRLELTTTANSDLGKVWKQVVGNTTGILSHETGWVCSHWVKVSEKSSVPARVNKGVVTKNMLNENLGTAIGRFWASRAFFRNGNHVFKTSGISVNSGRRGEHKSLNVVGMESLDQSDGTSNILVIVFKRNLSGFTDSLEASKVQN